MENATKALIIAAAVLIAILLIAFGMKIFNTTTGTSDDVKTTMTATEIATFNGKFTQHHGTNKSLAVVRSVADKVIAHNTVNTTRKVMMAIEGKTATDSANTIMTNISSLSGSTFTINVSIDSNTGLVTLITIS